MPGHTQRVAVTPRARRPIGQVDPGILWMASEAVLSILRGHQPRRSCSRRRSSERRVLLRIFFRGRGAGAAADRHETTTLVRGGRPAQGPGWLTSLCSMPVPALSPLADRPGRSTPRGTMLSRCSARPPAVSHGSPKLPVRVHPEPRPPPPPASFQSPASARKNSCLRRGHDSRERKNVIVRQCSSPAVVRKNGPRRAASLRSCIHETRPSSFL